MHTRPLGRTDLTLTELGFGAAPIGNLYKPTDDETAEAALHAAWGAGIRYFDTAPHYGLGLAERRLGRALAQYPRDEYVVSTKVGRLLVPNPAPTGSDLPTGLFAVPDTLTRRLDYSRDGVRRSLEESLQRLGLDRVDIVLVHDPDDFVDQVISEAIPALVELRDQGVIAAVGVGMNQWQAPLRMVCETDLDAVMLAGRWTLVDRTGAPLMDECARRGVSVLAAAPYNSGLLAHDWPPDGANFDYGPAPADVLARARSLAEIAQQRGASLPQLAMQFPLQHAATAAVVVGMRTADQVTSSAARLAAPLPDDVWDDVESLGRPDAGP
ncbi:MAG: D-threo-aldose 1-dehydrogenase [Pseudonocardiales bacterium]|jgi:D-threo-aldose 1-dehydrogenase|nr:D-threo-aldose 1-dehydrogenase [Pseudonocardiales bacterium]MDT4979174.1 D-threo-aldose 1-dehydrogenase [Pseudonocardiales bacterium]